MSKYLVYVSAVIVQPVLIDANSETKAKCRVYNGEGDILEDGTEYNEVNPVAWKVEKVGSLNYKVKMNGQ